MIICFRRINTVALDYIPIDKLFYGNSAQWSHMYGNVWQKLFYSTFLE